MRDMERFARAWSRCIDSEGAPGSDEFKKAMSEGRWMSEVVVHIVFPLASLSA